MFTVLLHSENQVTLEGPELIYICLYISEIEILDSMMVGTLKS